MDPLHHLVMVGLRVQTLHGVIDAIVTDFLSPMVHEILQVGWVDLWMALERQKLVIHGETSNGTVGRRGQNPGLFGQAHHLILMAVEQLQGIGRQGGFHPGRCLAQGRGLAAQSPSLGGSDDRSAQGLGDQLMAEADTGHAASFRVYSSDEIEQGGDPGVGIVHRMGRSAAEEGIMIGQCFGEHALLDPKIHPVNIWIYGGEPLLKHGQIIAMPGTQGIGRETGMEKGDFHGQHHTVKDVFLGLHGPISGP